MTAAIQLHAKKPREAGPFETADDMSNVTFTVEDRKLYFNKTVLSMASQVFKAKFTDDFREKSATEIPLPGKKYGDVEAFFKQIHPKHSADPITDTTLPALMALANEYQAISVLKRCLQYISQQINICSLKKAISNDQLLLYLWMCEQHRLTDLKGQILELGTKNKLTDIQKSCYYKSVPPGAMRDLAVKRALNLEAYIDEKVKPSIVKLSSRPSPFVSTNCQKSTRNSCSSNAGGICFECAEVKLGKIVEDLKQCP